MKKNIKLTALILALLMLIMLGMSACGAGDDSMPSEAVSDEPSVSPSPEATDTEDEHIASYEKLGIARDTVILSVNGEEVSAEEYFHWLDSSYQYLVSNYGAVQDWDGLATETLTIREYVLADALESVKLHHLFTTTGAPYGGAEITEEDQLLIDANYEAYISSFGGEEALKTALSESYFISLDTFIFTYCVVPQLYFKVFGNLFDSSDYLTAAGKDEVLTYIEENITGQDYIHAAHILFKTVDDSREPLPDEEIETKRQQAEDILAQLQAGADFNELMNAYSEDPGLASYPKGYYFNENSGFVTEFYNAAMALEENEMSGIVTTELGYHIILRLPVEAGDFAEEVCWNQYEDMLLTWREQAGVEFMEIYFSIDPKEIYG